MSEESKITVFRTIQGLDLIGVIIDEYSQHYVIEDLVAVRIGSRDIVEFGASCHPMIGHVDPKKRNAIPRVELQKTGLLYAYDPHPVVAEAYTEAMEGKPVETYRTPGNL